MNDAVSLKDKDFDFSDLTDAFLVIDISDKWIKTSVFSTSYNQFVGFDVFNSDMGNKIPYLKKVVKRKFLSFSSQKNILIPSSLFEEEKNIDLFNFNFEDFDSATEKIFYNKLNHLNAYMLFSLGNNIIEQWLSVSEYGNFFHRASAFLEVCMLFQNEYLKDDKTHPLIFIDVLDKSVFLSLFYLGKLAFFNQINFVQLQDMIFFLVKLTETLKVDIKKTEIFLSGNINFPKDKTISEIKKFFLHVYPFEFLNFFTTSPALKSLPVYKVNSLFNLPFCVS